MSSLNIKQAEQTVINLLKATNRVTSEGKGIPLVPFLKGMPGVGKSAMLRAVAKHFKLKLVDIRLSQEDPVCLNGALSVNGDRSSFLPPERFPLETDKVPEGYEGWLIFFDELPDAPKAIQSAAYRILLEREIGTHKINPKALMVAAGNRSIDRAGVSGELSSALKSRLVHINIHSDSDLFLDNIASWGWDRRIYSYLTWKPAQVNTFQNYLKGSADDTYCCERTWDMVNTYLSAIHPDQESKIPSSEITTLSGMIGSFASEFAIFTNSFDTLPSIESIMKNPTTCDVPSDEGAKYLLISMLASRLDEESQHALVPYVSRLGNAFMYPFIRMAWMSNEKVPSYETIKPHLMHFGQLSVMGN